MKFLLVNKTKRQNSQTYGRRVDIQVTSKNKNRIYTYPAKKIPWHQITQPMPSTYTVRFAADVVMFEKFAIPRNIRSPFRGNVYIGTEYLSRQGFPIFNTKKALLVIIETCLNKNNHVRRCLVPHYFDMIDFDEYINRAPEIRH